MRSTPRARMKAFIRGTATADDLVAVMVLSRPLPPRTADEVLALALMNRAGPEVGSWPWARGYRAAMSSAQFAQLQDAYLGRFGRFEADED